MSRCYTRKDLARRWRCSEDFVRDEIDAGRIATFRVKRTTLIRPEDVLRYEDDRIAEQSGTAPLAPVRDHF